jgi:hypothetical protein
MRIRYVDVCPNLRTPPCSERGGVHQNDRNAASPTTAWWWSEPHLRTGTRMSPVGPGKETVELSSRLRRAVSAMSTFAFCSTLSSSTVTLVTSYAMAAWYVYTSGANEGSKARASRTPSCCSWMRVMSIARVTLKRYVRLRNKGETVREVVRHTEGDTGGETVRETPAAVCGTGGEREDDGAAHAERQPGFRPRAERLQGGTSGDGGGIRLSAVHDRKLLLGKRHSHRILEHIRAEIRSEGHRCAGAEADRRYPRVL